MILFGVTNEPVIFINLINQVFAPYIDNFIVVFINDILEYLKTKEDHVRNLRIVLEILKIEKLCEKLSKCEF